MKIDWSGKRVAFLGSSITDYIPKITDQNYWRKLQDWLNITPLVYGHNGHRWEDGLGQAQALYADHPEDIDAVFIMLGANDYNHGTLPGEWWSMTREVVNFNGQMVPRMKRTMLMDKDTMKGCINRTMFFLREHYPTQQIVLMTPIHRGFASFSPTNVQPDENYCNPLGLFLEDYVKIIREAADIWACPLIDLYRNSGLLPNIEAQGHFFHLADTDRLHPNTLGHERIAMTMLAEMSRISSFRQ